MIKCDKGRTSLTGNVPVLCSEMACINMSMMNALQEADFTKDESIEKVR